MSNQDLDFVLDIIPKATFSQQNLLDYNISKNINKQAQSTHFQMQLQVIQIVDV